MRVVDEEQKDVAIGGVERRGVLRHLHERVVRHGRPVEQSRDLPARVARPVAGDTHHCLDQLMIPDPAIVRTGDGAQFYPAIVGFQRLYQLGAVREQSMLKVDASERCRQLPHVTGGCADQAAQLAVRPMGRCDGHVLTGHDQRQPFGIIAASLDA